MTNNKNIYDFLIQGNKKYGSDIYQICMSNFKCEPKDIWEKIIIAPTWNVEIFSNHVDNIKHISGPTGHGYNINEININNKKITYISTGIGACNILDAILALGCTPCKKILFIGSVGALDKNMEIGDIVIPEYSICEVGANKYLTMDNVSENNTFGNKYYPDKKFFNTLLTTANNITKNMDIKIHIGKTCSVESIFAQYAHLNEFINMGCNTIEMETSTLFHASNCVGIKAVAIFNISDNTITNKSLYNKGRNNLDQERRKKVKNDIIPKIVLEIL